MKYEYNCGVKWYKVEESGCNIMFMGEYRHALDAKGRLIIPARFREELQENFVVTRGFDGCLRIHTRQQYQALLEQLKRLPNTKKETRMYAHVLTVQATECNLDNQGRILLSSNLKAAAKIDKDCVVVGVGDHVEIWASDRWDQYYDEASASFDDIAEQLTDFLL